MKIIIYLSHPSCTIFEHLQEKNRFHSANSAKTPDLWTFWSKKHILKSPHVVLWFLNTSFSCFGRQVLIGCGYGPLTIGAFNLVWTSPATSRGSECPVGRRPRCKKQLRGKCRIWKGWKLEISRLQRSRISEFRMIFHDFIVNLVKSSTQRLVTILQISISLMNSPSKKYVVFLEDIQNNSFFFISDVSVPKMSFLALV